jgi:hypothetical protein
MYSRNACLTYKTSGEEWLGDEMTNYLGDHFIKLPVNKMTIWSNENLVK